VRVANVVPQLRTSNLAQSIRFYTTQLGFALDFEYQDFYAGVRTGGHTVHLKLVATVDPSVAFVEQGDHVHLYIEVDDIDAAAERLRQNGVAIEREVHETPWGARELVIKDDQGHTLYYGQPL
jgi:catechol 2,3-dioxygenase-like lactoylglutathione lyase family enzyme